MKAIIPLLEYKEGFKCPSRQTYTYKGLDPENKKHLFVQGNKQLHLTEEAMKIVTFF